MSTIWAVRRLWMAVSPPISRDVKPPTQVPGNWDSSPHLFTCGPHVGLEQTLKQSVSLVP